MCADTSAGPTWEPLRISPSWAATSNAFGFWVLSGASNLGIKAHLRMISYDGVNLYFQIFDLTKSVTSKIVGTSQIET